MGFDTVIENLVSSTLSSATGWASDFMPLIGLALGASIFGTIVLIVKRFGS